MHLLFIGILLFDFGFAKIFHGIGMEMTNNGTGVYYKPGIPLSSNSQVIGDIGLQFDTNIQSNSLFVVEERNQSVFLNLSAGYRRELLQEMIAGIFRPVVIFQGGGLADIYSFSGQDITGNWIILYGTGAGFQFYNGRNLNEILLKVNRNTSRESNIAFQISIYWR